MPADHFEPGVVLRGCTSTRLAAEFGLVVVVVVGGACSVFAGTTPPPLAVAAVDFFDSLALWTALAARAVVVGPTFRGTDVLCVSAAGGAVVSVGPDVGGGTERTTGALASE